MSIAAIRIAKFIANAGYSSRRRAEELIFAGLVKVNGEVIQNPATHVTQEDNIEVEGKALERSVDKTRLWLYYKPIGVITSHSDTYGRTTVFENLPESLPRVISVGRLDLNSEGLLLLTNNGKLARYLELPENAFSRIYKVRVFGEFDLRELQTIEQGITIDEVHYKPAKLSLVKSGTNSWFLIELSEGKNREIRKIFSHFNLNVNRLIRVKYGPFALHDLEPGDLKEVPYNQLLNLLPKKVVESL